MNKAFLSCCAILLTALGFSQSGELRTCVYPKNDVVQLPELYLETSAQVNATKRVEATFSAGLSKGNCAIEYHGNSTLAAAKKSYDLEFRTLGGMETQQRILGLPTTACIVLLANVFDPSMLRNALAFDVWEQLGNTAATYSFCHLYVNGEYKGVYMATEKIRTVDRLIDRTAWTPNPELLNNPFLMKIDWENEGNVRIQGINDWPLTAQVLDPKPFTDKWMGYNSGLERYFAKIDSSLSSIINPTIKSNHYAEYIDVASFVDYFLVNELTKNPDAYHSSLFLHSALSGKLAIGPVWDFDLAFANTMNPADDEIEGWMYKKDFTYNELRTTPKWWYLLMCDTSFRSLCLARLEILEQWMLSDAFQIQLSDHVDQLRPAMLRDNERWGSDEATTVLGPLDLTLDEKVLYLCSFLEKRLQWMKGALPTESCLSPFEVKAKQERYDPLVQDPGKKQFTVKFDYDLTYGLINSGSRYQYFAGYSYLLKDAYGNMVQQGPVSGTELRIDATNLPIGKYYLVVTEFSNDQLLATSAVRMPLVYRKMLIVR